MAANKLQQRNAIRKFSFHAEARKSNKRERETETVSINVKTLAIPTW